MSEAIAPAQQKPARKISLSLEHFKEAMAHPLRLIPLEVREAALTLWVCNKHLTGMESALPIASRIAVHMDRHNLRPDDAVTILEQLLNPKEMQRIEYASQLLARLSFQISEAIDRRANEAAMRKRREEGWPTAPPMKFNSQPQTATSAANKTVPDKSPASAATLAADLSASFDLDDDAVESGRDAAARI